MFIAFVFISFLHNKFPFYYIFQAIRLKYLHPDSELQNFALQVMEILNTDASVDSHALVFLGQVTAFCFC